MGIAMGMSTVPTIATLYVAIHEQAQIFGKFEFLEFYHGLIDNGFTIWKHHPHHDIDVANYKSFEDTICGEGLDWTFTEQAKPDPECSAIQQLSRD